MLNRVLFVGLPCRSNWKRRGAKGEKCSITSFSTCRECAEIFRQLSVVLDVFASVRFECPTIALKIGNSVTFMIGLLCRGAKGWNKSMGFRENRKSLEEYKHMSKVVKDFCRSLGVRFDQIA